MRQYASVAYPQSNGRAELAVKTAKRIVNENLLHPRLRDSIPLQPFLYKPHPEWIAAAQCREEILHKRNAKLVEIYNSNNSDNNNSNNSKSGLMAPEESHLGTVASSKSASSSQHQPRFCIDAQVGVAVIIVTIIAVVYCCVLQLFISYCLGI